MNNNEIPFNNMEEIMNVKYCNEISIREFMNKGLNCLYLNIRSLRNKLDELELLLISIKTKVHVIILTESHIRPQEKQFFNIPQCTAYHACRENSIGGGVSIFVHNTILSTFVIEKNSSNYNMILVHLPILKLNVLGAWCVSCTAPNIPATTIRSKYE